MLAGAIERIRQLRHENVAMKQEKAVRDNNVSRCDESCVSLSHKVGVFACKCCGFAFRTCFSLCLVVCVLEFVCAVSCSALLFDARFGGHFLLESPELTPLTQSLHALIRIDSHYKKWSGTVLNK